MCYKLELSNVATYNFTFKTALKSGGHYMINYSVTVYCCSAVSGNLFLQSSAVGLFCVHHLFVFHNGQQERGHTCGLQVNNLSTVQKKLQKCCYMGQDLSFHFHYNALKFRIYKVITVLTYFVEA